MMAGLDLERLSGLNLLYAGPGSDPSFAEVLNHIAAHDDEGLAELIEADGRQRIGLNRAVPLERYLEAVTDLPERADALDAAIDMSLRWLVHQGMNQEDAAARLIEAHGDLEEAIRESTALGQALWSTTRMRAGVASKTPSRMLPSDFGPSMADGRQRYELQRFLGEGAFGQVYLAVDRQLSEAGHAAYVSIKVLSRRERDPWSRQRLIDEATKARRIDHPNVVRVLDRGVSADDEDFIVYEYVDGGDLARWSRRRRTALEIDEAIQLSARIARGVHAAHMAGLVHCDLKPANVLLTAAGEPKVADFGIAIRTAEGERARWSSCDRPLGNLAFISPEQYRMEPGAITPPSDLYALGGILYWLLTAQLPNGSTVEEIHRAHDPVHGRRAPPSLRAVRPGIDRDAEAICGRATAQRAEDRYASAAEFAHDLESWLAREPIRWTRPSLTRRLGLWARRKPALAASLAVIAVLIAGGAVVGPWLWLRAARAEIEHAKRQQFVAAMAQWVDHLKRARDAGLSYELLPQVWLGEWLYGPMTLGQDLDPTELWTIRNQTIRALVERGHAAGRENDVEILMWESALAFWLLNDGEVEESREILDRNYERWRALTRSDDAWLLDLRAVRACANIARAANAGGLGPSVESWPAEVAEAPTVLAAADESLRGRASGTPIHRLVLKYRILLYGAEFLNDPARRAELEATLAQVVK